MTICRFTKLKSMAEISGSAAHMIRSDHAANADPERAGLNRVIVGGSDPAAEVRDRLEGILSRTNPFFAIEVMLSASPEWWVGANRIRSKRGSRRACGSSMRSSERLT
ncbi:plasmid recombination protein [Devosia sp.]|uniref:plasmid recombination protein n=1 Tax=Devosia sp. TaxID=1871048 RepID=UPI0025D30FAF|nr:plasmid recombination protein [Devosia sp.]MCR6634907.1 plasmid recombination protein [Devosia sp.]